jgi:hypothetical protein
MIEISGRTWIAIPVLLSVIAVGTLHLVTQPVSAAPVAMYRRTHSPPGLPGRYELAVYNGREVPTSESDGEVAGPCPSGGGELTMLHVREGWVTLFEDGAAELSRTLTAYCDSPGSPTRTVDVPEHARGRYRVEGNRVHVTTQSEAPLALRWSPDTGTLAAADSSIIYQRFGVRTAAAQGNPHRIFELLLANLNPEDTVHRDRAAVPAQPSRAPTDLRFARLSRWAAGRFEPDFVVALQRDSALRRPMAAEGSILHVVAPATRTAFTARVLARAAVSGIAECGGRIDGPSWAYLLDTDTTRVPAQPNTGRAAAVLAFGVPFTSAPASQVPPGVREALRTPHRALIDQHFQAARAAFRSGDAHGTTLESFRNSMYGEDGYGDLTGATFHPVRGPNGPVYLVAVRMRDDPSSYGVDEASYTYLVDRGGRVVNRLRGFRTVLLVGDGDGDGVDEIVTASGTMYWGGTRWMDAGPDQVSEIC